MLGAPLWEVSMSRMPRLMLRSQYEDPPYWTAPWTRLSPHDGPYVDPHDTDCCRTGDRFPL